MNQNIYENIKINVSLRLSYTRTHLLHLIELSALQKACRIVVHGKQRDGNLHPFGDRNPGCVTLALFKTLLSYNKIHDIFVCSLKYSPPKTFCNTWFRQTSLFSLSAVSAKKTQKKTDTAMPDMPELQLSFPISLSQMTHSQMSRPDFSRSQSIKCTSSENPAPILIKPPWEFDNQTAANSKFSWFYQLSSSCDYFQVIALCCSLFAGKFS